MRSLPDINVWLALSFENHAHHEAALAWFETLDVGDTAFIRMTQQGFLRLASNPSAMQAETISMSECWKVYDELLADDRVSFAVEPGSVEPCWRSLTENDSFSPKVWNDAYLAAFAICSGMELVTFDTGLRRYEGLELSLLA